MPLRFQPTRLVLLGLFLPLAALRVLILLTRHIPMDHDAFQYLQLQYVFFNEAATHGRLAQWLPLEARGVPSALWLVVSQGLLVSALAPLAAVFKQLNFLPIFESGLLLDELVLVVGATLLARRCYSSRLATILVPASLAYTAVSALQPWWNFHLFYLLPLILYCIDRLATEGSHRYLALATLFAAATVLANLPYYLPLTFFTLCIFAGARATLGGAVPARITGPMPGRLSWRRVVVLLIPLCLAAALAWGLRDSLAHAVFATGRNAYGGTALHTFLTWGGATGIEKYRDLIGRYPGDRDNTLYGGILVLPFCVIALARVRLPMSYVFGVTALVMALFSSGTFVSRLFYYAIPFGKYYRDLGHAAPLVKMFLIFYAGYGVDEFWTLVREPRPRGDQIVLAAAAAPLILGAIVILVQAIHGTLTFAFPTPGGLYYVLALCVAAGALLLAIPRWPRSALVLASVVVALHAGDLLWFKVEMEYADVPRAGPDVVHLFRPSAYRFPAVRTQDYYANRRFAILAPAILQGDRLSGGGTRPYFYDRRPRAGVLYSTIESFVFLDSAASPFRTDFWQDGVDEFYRAWVAAADDVPEHLGFPIPASPAYRKLVGLEYPKLQLFSKIHVVAGDGQIAARLAAPAFAGDQVFISSKDASRALEGGGLVVDQADPIEPRATDRLGGGSVEVRAFTPDALDLQVTNPASVPAVLYYADAWDPRWRATVNGTPAPVMRANLGFKSVLVPPGLSSVTFTFGDPWGRLLTEIPAVLSLLVLTGIVFLLRDTARL